MKIYYNLVFTILILFVSGIARPQNTESAYFVSYDEIAKIIDGDTFKFKKTDKSKRLLFLDTEETFKGKNALEKSSEIAENWMDYYFRVKLEKGTDYPIKLESPFGYETVEWTSDFFKGVQRVRIELDDSLRTMDVYGRELVYVFVEKDGKFINYNLECVKRGYSPYFNKYGNSKRFHADFLNAQEYAQKNRLGIWNPAAKCYPDYDDRIKWWNDRAAQIDNFNLKYLNNPVYINLLNNDASAKLFENIGKVITVFCTVTEVLTNRFPYLLRIMLSKDVFVDLYINETESVILNQLDIGKIENYLFYCTGLVELNGNKFRIKLSDKLQIKIE